MARFLNGPARETRWEMVWFAATGFFAFAIGTTFRLAEATGQGLFRMFGTFLLVVLGYCGTQGIRALYSSQSRGQIRAALAAAQGFVLFRPEIGTEAGAVRPTYLWLGPRGLVAVFISDRTFGKNRLPSELIQAEEKSQQILRLLSGQIEKIWAGGGASPPAVEAAVILTRQPGLPLPIDFEGRRIHLLNPEGFERYLKTPGPKPLSDQEALAVLEALGLRACVAHQ